MLLIIPGSLPGLNEYINAERSNKFKAAAMKKQVEQLIIYLARSKRWRAEKPVYIRYLWVEKNKRRDKDNIAFAKKFVQDSLVKAGVLHNDGWADIVGFEDAFTVDGENPRVEVEITEVEE